MTAAVQRVKKLLAMVTRWSMDRAAVRAEAVLAGTADGGGSGEHVRAGTGLEGARKEPGQAKKGRQSMSSVDGRPNKSH